jgi:hypothetical protein
LRRIHGTSGESTSRYAQIQKWALPFLPGAPERESATGSRLPVPYQFWNRQQIARSFTHFDMGMRSLVSRVNFMSSSTPSAHTPIILVHGTFAGPKEGSRQWYEPDSDFCRALDKALEKRGVHARCWAGIEPLEYFHWGPGTNDWLDRAELRSDCVTISIIDKGDAMS